MENYEYLTDLERSLVEAFNANETQREAVKKVLLHSIHGQGVIQKGNKYDPKRNWALAFAWRDELSNEQLGQDLRASAQGIRFLEMAFNDLTSKFIKKEPAKNKKNPAV